MNHFGRFRVINHTAKSAGDKPATVKKATVTLGMPLVLKTVVGFGTPFPELPPQFYAELELEPGMIYTTSVKVDIEINVGTVAAPVIRVIKDWDLDIGGSPAVIELRGIDIKLDYKLDGADKWRARATLAGANYEFHEPNWKTFT